MDQLLLPLTVCRNASPRVLVKLNASDLRFRELCVRTEREFGSGFLKETRAQRLGCTLQAMDSMLNYELARHLAEEASIMRSDNWETCRPVWIDWQAIDFRAKEKAKEISLEFEAFRRHQREAKTTEAKNKRGRAV